MEKNNLLLWQQHGPCGNYSQTLSGFGKGKILRAWVSLFLQLFVGLVPFWWLRLVSSLHVPCLWIHLCPFLSRFLCLWLESDPTTRHRNPQVHPSHLWQLHQRCATGSAKVATVGEPAIRQDANEHRRLRRGDSRWLRCNDCEAQLETGERTMKTCLPLLLIYFLLKIHFYIYQEDLIKSSWL